jgi:DNA adenine methylase
MGGPVKNTQILVGSMKDQHKVTDHTSTLAQNAIKSFITEKVVSPKIKSIVKIYGGKYALSNWIIEHLPPNYREMNYCEPFCGTATVLLNKEASVSEIISDNDAGLISILRSLRDEPEEFQERIKKTKYNEYSFKKSLKLLEESQDYVEKGIHEYIARKMSKNGLKHSFSEEKDPSIWKTSCQQLTLQQLTLIADRLQNTTILTHDFKEVIKVWNEEETLFYLDPPNLQQNQKSEEEPDMSIEDHLFLLNQIKDFKGKVIISAIHSSLYHKHLKGWKCVKKEIGKSSDKKYECLWTNY